MISLTDYEKVKEIFSAALDLAPDERFLFIGENCADENVRREVESLLQAREEAGKFLDDVSAVKIVQESFNRNDKFIGQIVNKYKIEREIGRGGMGAVYLATRNAGDFQKCVAVKVIKRGADSDETLRRFRQERQILAALEHPNIARLIDGGTTADDTPYLIMEYVEGVPIDEFCTQNELSTEEKLKLFQKICAAVAHAHRNLTIHRDLKASNILVTNDGEPKLLDFGIAKIFSNDGEQNNETQTNFRALTPEYASPEQLRGEKLTTATDVYSLGVILYELLTGTRPFQIGGKTLAEVLQMVSETKPLRPSTIQSLKSNLSKDLDNIILKSLAKEPERRYNSVEQFSEDIERYLKGLPIAARPDTFFYRAEKFVRRNNIGVSLAAAAILLMLTGLAIIIYEYRVAEIERGKAERRAENLRKLSNSFAVELHGAILNLPGSLPARQLLITRAVEQLDALAADSNGNPAVMDELAQGYYTLGALPDANIADGERNYRKAVAIYQKLLAEQPENAHYRRQLAKGLLLLGDLQKVRGSIDGALTFHLQTVEILEPLTTENPDEQEIINDLLEAYSNIAADLYQKGEAEKSLEYRRRALNLAGHLNELDPNNADYLRQLYNSRAAAARNLQYLGDYKTAIAELRTALTESFKQAAAHPNDVRYNYDQWTFHRRLGEILEQTGEHSVAVRELETAVELMENLRSESPDDDGYNRNTAFSHLSLGQSFIRQNQPQKALPELRRALDLSEKLLAAEPERGETSEDLAEIYAGFGTIFGSLGKSAESLENFRRSKDLYEKSIKRDGQNAILKRNFAETLMWFAAALAKSQNANERRQAIENYQNSLAIWKDLQQNKILAFADKAQPETTEQMLTRLNHSI